MPLSNILNGNHEEEEDAFGREYKINNFNNVNYIGEQEVYSLVGAAAAGKTRLLHVYYDDWLMRKARVTDSDAAQVDKVVFPYWTCTRIEVVLEGQTIELCQDSMWRSARSFTSTIIGAEDDVDAIWRYDGQSSESVLGG
ncbi:hypothetical protein DV737_g2445, partial [Chaetothyriales sp. CBS 132003]